MKGFAAPNESYKSVTMGLSLHRITPKQTQISVKWWKSDEGLQIYQTNSVIVTSILEPEMHTNPIQVVLSH